MMDLFKSSYYWLDLLVGFGSPLLLFACYRLNRISRRDWRLFWIGAAIGLSWEIPIFLMSKISTLPIIHHITEPPVHYLILMICHTLWDGAFFLVGAWLAVFIRRRPILVKFNWVELAIMVAWGQISAFLVEFSSIINDAWIYHEGYWWNPSILTFNDRPITLMIQVVWFFAPILFYFIALKIARFDDNPRSE